MVAGTFSHLARAVSCRVAMASRLEPGHSAWSSSCGPLLPFAAGKHCVPSLWFEQRLIRPKKAAWSFSPNSYFRSSPALPFGETVAISAKEVRTEPKEDIMKHTQNAMVGQPPQMPVRAAGGREGESRDTALSASERYRLELQRRGIEPIE